MKRRLVLLFLIIVMIFPQPIYALTCLKQPFFIKLIYNKFTYILHYNAVFIGSITNVIDRDQNEASHNPNFITVGTKGFVYTVAVEQTFRGRIGKELTVGSGGSPYGRPLNPEESEKMVSRKIGQKYLFYTNSKQGDTYVQTSTECGGTSNMIRIQDALGDVIWLYIISFPFQLLMGNYIYWGILCIGILILFFIKRKTTRRVE